MTQYSCFIIDNIYKGTSRTDTRTSCSFLVLPMTDYLKQNTSEEISMHEN